MLMMKKSIISTFIGLILTCSMVAQVDMHPWAPTGATWLYKATSQTSQLYIKLTYQKDTLFAGKSVKKVVVSKFGYIGIPPNLVRTKEAFVANEYMYNVQDSVFWYNNNAFQLLYVFSATNGSSWNIQKSSYFNCLDSGTPNFNAITVRTVQQATLGNKLFTVIDANPQPYWTIGTRLIKNIGPVVSPFPIPGNLGCSVIDGNTGVPESLMCYYDNTRGSIDFGGVGNCQGLITRINDVNKNSSESFAIYPNPVSHTLRVVNTSNFNVENIEIFDIFGKQHLSIKYTENMEIDANNLASGVYVVALRTSNKSIHLIKFAKVK
jgi:hypothetical protein